jgi:GMP reductase
MRIEQEIKLDFDDVLIKPKRSETGSRANVNLNRSFNLRNCEGFISKKTGTISGVPIIASNMDTVGTFAMCEKLSKHHIFTCLHKFYSEEELKKFYEGSSASWAFYTLGISNEEIKKLENVAQVSQIPGICLDVANGYTKYFVEKVKYIREKFPYAVILAGNVATADMTQELLVNGADIVKIGIGPGKVCETRKVTGVGYPQLSAIIECADVAHGVGGHICADGGCSTSGDIAKAFGAGADFVMLGTMLAGHDECEGEWVYDYSVEHTGEPGYTPGIRVFEDKNKKKSLKVYGMSSREAMNKYYGGVASHRAPEGKCIYISYKGSVDNTINDILGGLRSTCTYVGTDDIKHLSKCTTFIRKNR